MLFLIFISVMMSIVSCFTSDSFYILSSLSWWVFSNSEFLWLTERKEKWLEKVSTKWKSRESFLFKLSKEGKFSFRWLLESTIELLIFVYCLAISWNMAMWWELLFLECYSFKKEVIICCLGSNDILRWCQLPILSR